MNCPYCDYEMSPPEYVDVGVGSVQVTPWECENCRAYQISPYHPPFRELNPWEIEKGFYEPDDEWCR